MGAGPQLTDLGMLLSLPYNHQPDYLTRMAPFFHATYDVYLAPPPEVASSLKSFAGDARGYARERRRLREALAPHGAGLCYVFNAPHYPEGDARILRFLEAELRAAGRAAVTVSSFDLGVAIHAALPDVELGTSLACGIRGVVQARAWVERAGARIIHPDKLLLRRPRELAELKALGVRLKIIINNRCAIHSLRCAAHLACAALREGREEADREISARCGEDLRREPWRTAPITLPPALLPRLRGLVDIVKLDGRNWPTRQLVDDARDTLELASWSYFPWYVEPPEAFDVLARCDHRCHACGWCAANFRRYAPEAAEPPQVARQVLCPDLPTPPVAGALPPAARLPRLFAPADRFGFTVVASRVVLDATAVEVDLRWRGGGPYRLRLATRGSALDGPCFRRTRTLCLCYLFEESKAPPGLLADLERLCERVAAIDQADGEGRGSAVGGRRSADGEGRGSAVGGRRSADGEGRGSAVGEGRGPLSALDRLEVGGFCVQHCVFCDAPHVGRRASPLGASAPLRETAPSAATVAIGAEDPAPDPRLVHPSETRAFLELLAGRRVPRGRGTVPRLELTGDDPARRADLPELVAAARRAGYRQIVALGPANALAAPGWAKRLRAAGLTHAAVSLHADRAAVHDRLAGRPGAFAETLAALRRLRRAGVALELSTVALTPSLPRLAAMARLLRAERVHLHFALGAPGAAPAEAASLAAVAPAVAAFGAELRKAGARFPELHLYGLPRCVADDAAARWPGRAVYREALRAFQRERMAFASVCDGCTLRPICLGVPSWCLPPLAVSEGATSADGAECHGALRPRKS
ncbi:MAG: radical SAM protein [Deltaproteobacteria bacterium]|nr:radical SAM protein [Deltaproteobacteria bacterium]